jgi:hypothetical protein
MGPCRSSYQRSHGTEIRYKTIQSPSLGTLLPCREESINFDTTQNLIIEGDNLKVLKLLQKSYLGKIKMIYIDPPYNTGNDFIYPTTAPRVCKPISNTQARWMQRGRSSAPPLKLMAAFTRSG